MNPFHELRDVIRELRELIYWLSRRHKFIAVIVQQECKVMNPASLVTGKPAQATAVAVDTSGNTVATTFTCASDNTASATIDQTGLITIVDVGTGNFTATDPGGDVGTCPFTVTQAGPGVLKITVDVTQ